MPRKFIKAELKLSNITAQSLSLVFDIPGNLKNSLYNNISSPIKKFLDQMNCPQITYNKSLLHISLFIFIGSDLRVVKIDKKDIQRYKDLSEVILNNVGKFKLTLSKIVIDDKGIRVVGFPLSRNFLSVRKEIKKMLESYNLKYSDSLERDLIHTSLIKWREPISKEKRINLISFIESLGNKKYKWSMNLNKVDLVLWSIYNSKRKKKIVKPFYLN